MPVMGGRAFLREHVRQAGTNVPPVVVMSGAPEAAAQALHLGATAVIAKSFRLEELEALLARLTDASECQVGCER
jgi:CheY-like chemotaxis protein